MAIDNKIDHLDYQTMIKYLGFKKQAHELWEIIWEFETLRTLERQRELLKKWQSKTMNSYHLKWKAIDVVYYDKWKPSRKWNYNLLHKIWKCYWLDGIGSWDACHFQDNWLSINSQKVKNSATWLISDEFWRKLLKNANDYFRSIKD